eukprot:6182029-Pleurochrysis_carterae.AAC.1
MLQNEERHRPAQAARKVSKTCRPSETSNSRIDAHGRRQRARHGSRFDAQTRRDTRPLSTHRSKRPPSRLSRRSFLSSPKAQTSLGFDQFNSINAIRSMQYDTFTSA